MEDTRANAGATDQDLAAEAGIPPECHVPRLSLAMIVRDAEHTLPDALASVQGVVDEIVVVDTGSVDSTPQIARDHGARVFEMEWPDCFATARNESLRHATGDWVLWMDADDVLPEASARRLRSLVNERHSSDVDAFVMQVHCPPVEGGLSDEVTAVDHLKLFRNGRGYRFKGRIHEQVLWSIREANGRVEWTDIHVVHANSDGTPEGLARKLDRDLRLLKLEVAENPTSSFALFNFGMTLEAGGMYQPAIDALSRAAMIARNQESHVRKLYAILAGCWASLDQHEAAATVLDRGLRLFPGDAELLFRLGTALLRLGDPARAADLFRSVVQGGDGQKFGSIDLSIRRRKALANLAVALERSGRFEESVETWIRVASDCPEDPDLWFGLAEMCARNAEVHSLDGVLDGLNESVSPVWFTRFIQAVDQTYARNEDQALIDCEACLAAVIESDRARVLDFIGRAVFGAPDTGVAGRCLTELAELRPSDGAVLFNVAVIHLRNKDLESAERVAKESLRIRPDHQPTRDLLGTIRHSKGEAADTGESPHVVDSRGSQKVP